MADIINLDALILREDFELKEEASIKNSTIQTLSVRDLERDSFFYAGLRKPDFQRETNEWGVKKIAEFIESFANGELIPALILWQGGNNIFVIDGAHRLSSLIAWVQDDYGDGLGSRNLFNRLPDDQVKAAEKVRREVKRLIGTYAEHKEAALNPDKYSSSIVGRAKRLASLALQLQWVTGNAQKAENAFFKINQSAAPIDKTELKLLKSRNYPNSLAARAIMRAGTGHKYWSNFDKPKQEEIETIANTINNLLFTPNLTPPIKTLDLPIAGKGYSSQSLPIIFDLVNITSVPDSDNPKADATGDTTIEYLNRTKNIVNRLTGTHPSSLGLHPAVYFYSESGRYQPTAFFAVVQLILEMERENAKLISFTESRRSFEEFLLANKNIVNQVTIKYGSGLKGFVQLKNVFQSVLNELVAGKPSKDILQSLKVKFSYLSSPVDLSEEEPGEFFSTNTKSAIFLREALKEPQRCSICGGLIHTKSISFDHVVRRQDGGMGSVGNGALAHPFCNTTFKN